MGRGGGLAGTGAGGEAGGLWLPVHPAASTIPMTIRQIAGGIHAFIQVIVWCRPYIMVAGDSLYRKDCAGTPEVRTGFPAAWAF